MTVLKTRLFFGGLLILAAVATLTVDGGFAPYYPLLALTIGTVVWVATGELADLLRKASLPVQTSFCRFGCLAIVAGNWSPCITTPSDAIGPNLHAPFALFVAFGLAVFVMAAWRYHPDKRGTAIAQIAGHLLVLFYLGLLGSCVIQVRWLGGVGNPTLGAQALFLAIFIPKGCDIAAFFTGRALGRHKMAPTLSPGKTWEGFAGGLVGAVLLAILAVGMGQWLWGTAPAGMWGAVALGLALGGLGPIGDLVESLIKRDSGEKDASANIPGFGGILDVVDSVVFCGPAAFFLMVCV